MGTAGKSPTLIRDPWSVRVHPVGPQGQWTYQAGREAVMNGPTALQPVYPQPIPLEPRAQSAVGRLCALCLQPARPSSVLTRGVRSFPECLPSRVGLLSASGTLSHTPVERHFYF